MAEDLRDRLKKIKAAEKRKKENYVVERFSCGCVHISELKLNEKKWSMKYKRSIDCSNPKGFSQKAHCAGRKKRKREDKAFKDRNRPIKEIGSGRGLKPFDPRKEKKKSATKFNAKLKAASKAGKLSGKFKEAVDASPVKMKKSPAKLAKSLKEAAKITKAQLQGKKITVVDGGSKMAKRAKADYEKQQKAKAIDTGSEN